MTGVAGAAGAVGAAVVVAARLAARFGLAVSNAATWASDLGRIGASKEQSVSAMSSPAQTLPGLGLLEAERSGAFFFTIVK